MSANLRSASRAILGLPAMALLAAPALAVTHFSQITTPAGVVGERSTTAIVHLNGVAPSNVSAYVSYGTSAAAVEARPGTYGEARCAPYQPGQLRCTMIFPHPHARTPNARDANPVVIAAGQTVHFRWRKDMKVSWSNETLTLSDTARSFVMPRRLAVAVMGDSYSSGEGAPSGTSKWLYEPCHRSARSGQRLGVRDFMAQHRNIAVHYFIVTCSGAQIWGSTGRLPSDRWPGLLSRGMTSWAESEEQPQLYAIKDWMTRYDYDSLDALVMQVGGNDMGFGDIVTACIIGDIIDCSRKPSVQAMIDAGLAGLVDDYRILADNIRLHLKPRFVYIGEYPDPTRGTDGNFCDTAANHYACFNALDRRLQRVEAEFAYNRALLPLNETLSTAAARHGWRLMGGHVARTRTRGLCACDTNTFNTIKQSFERQGDINGAVHMYAGGQDIVYRASVRNALRRDLGPIASRRTIVQTISPLRTRGLPGRDPEPMADEEVAEDLGDGKDQTLLRGRLVEGGRRPPVRLDQHPISQPVAARRGELARLKNQIRRESKLPSKVAPLRPERLPRQPPTPIGSN